MNSTWSSFTKTNPSTNNNETNILQEFLRTNVFHQNKNENISKNSSEVTTNENLPSEKKLENETQEIHLQMTSKSVTRLQGENISENTSVLKMYSKTTLKKKELSGNELLNEEKGAASSGRNETRKENGKLKSLYSWTEEKCASCDKKEEDQFPVKEIRNTEDRIMGDAFFSYPPEVVEIYFSKKDKKSSTRTLPKEDDECCASNSGESVFLFSRINSRNIEEGWTFHNEQKAEESNVLNRDKLVESIQDRQNVINLNTDYKFEKNQCNLNEGCLNDVENCIKEIEEHKDSAKSDVKEENCSSEELKSQKIKDTSDIDKVISFKDLSAMPKRNFNLADNLRSLEDEEFLKIEEKSYGKIEKSQESNNNEQKLNTKSNYSHKIKNVSFSALKDNVSTNQTENKNSRSNSTLMKAEGTESNQILVKSKENGISKSSLTSVKSNDLKYSKSDLSSKENIKIIRNEEKLNCKEENSIANSSKENKMKIVVKKRENKIDKFNQNTIDDIEINLLNKDAQLTSIINDKKENSHDSKNEITRIEIEDPITGMITQKTTRISDDYKDINICKMLTNVHEQLTYDLQRMKRIETKLLGKVSTDPTNHTTALQLLDKTVARCKSYIHGSNNSQGAELEIIQIFLKHGVELMMAVNKNKAALDEQERRMYGMQFEALRGQNVMNEIKINILKEINLSWNFWKQEIIRLIELISYLIKNVMVNNEEKENLKYLQKYKLNHRRTPNNLPTHDIKPKTGSGRSKHAKISLFKKESAVETQISIASNSKGFVKPLSNSVNREKGKIPNDGQVSEKKTMEKGRTMKESSQNKNRVIISQQPVWRPGGMVKIPSSNSATMLQKARSNVKEKNHLFVEHARDEKSGRTTTLSKKKASNGVSSMRNMLSSNTDNFKIVGRRSNTSLKISPRMKPKPKTPRATLKNFNEPARQIVGYSNSKYCDNKSSHEEFRQKNSKDTKILNTLKETIKFLEMNDKEEINRKNLMDSTEYPSTFEPPSEPVLITEEKGEIAINKEEPTRDVDSCKFIKNHLKPSDMVHKNHPIAEKIPDSSLSSEKALDLSKHVSKRFENHIDAGINTNGFSNFISIANISSNSDRTTKFEVSSHCQTSFNSISSSNTQNREKKLTDSSILLTHGEETQKDAFVIEKEKIRRNSHALSLNLLKEFLWEQGIDADFVNRAERELKIKQMARRHSKKKSISFADMLYSVEDESLQKNSKDEHLRKMMEMHEESFINCQQNLKNIEEDDINCIKSLKYAENINNCEKDIKSEDKHIQKDLNCEKNSELTENQEKRNNNNCEKRLMDTENYERNMINSEESLNHLQNAINCEKSTKHAGNYTENDINFKKNSGYIENQKEDNNYCEESLKHAENYKENDINLKKNLKCTENDKKDKGNCQNNVKDVENYKESNSCCENSLKHSENHEENNINCIKSLKHTKNHKEDNTNCENTSEPTKIHKENNINCGNTSEHPKNVLNLQKEKRTENYKESIVKESPQPETKDASSCTDRNTNDVSSQTNFQDRSSETLQTVPKHSRVVETQTETKHAKHVRNLSNEVRNVSSMTETLPVRDNFTETIRVPCVSKSVSTEQIHYTFLNNCSKNLTETLSNDSNELCTKMISNENSPKRCRNFFRQLLNQMQEKCDECSNCEENDASRELRFVESNVSTLYASSGSSSESLRNREEMMKEANTSPIRNVSSETMAAFHVTAIRIRNIYRAIDIYKRKLRNKPKKTEKGLSKRGFKSCNEKPNYVSRSSSVDTIFKKNMNNDKNGVIRMYEALRQAEVESIFDKESPDEDSESIKSSSSTTWSYESTFGKVELKLSGKLSDTIVLKDIKSLMEFLVQKTEDSMLEKKNSVQKISNYARTKIQNNEIIQFSIFSRENLLPLVYGVMCCIVFWCLRFTITCDVVL